MKTPTTISNETLTFFFLLLIRELLLDGVDLLGGDEVTHIVADTHSLQVASHVIGKTNSIIKSIRAVGAFPLHAPQRLRVIDLVRVLLENALRQETRHVLLIRVVVFIVAVGLCRGRHDPAASPQKKHLSLFLFVLVLSGLFGRQRRGVLVLW